MIPIEDIIKEIEIEKEEKNINRIESKIEVKNIKLIALNIKIPMFLKNKLIKICKETGLTQTEVIKQLIENCKIIKGEN